jgi:hypothetical protein
MQPPVEPPAPERPKRKPEPKTSLAGRVVGVLVVLALAAATVVLSKLEVMPSDRMPAFATEGKRGEVVTTNTFKVRIDKPFVAKKLVYKELSFSDPDVRTTGGVWLVVPAAVQSQKAPERFEGATLVSKSGKKYANSNRIPGTFMPGGQGTSPGIAFLGVWVFEVPPEEIPGSQLWVSVSPSSPELASQARVDLGLGEDVVKNVMPTYDLSKDKS